MRGSEKEREREKRIKRSCTWNIYYFVKKRIFILRADCNVDYIARRDDDRLDNWLLCAS